jgi:2-oxoglutarate/2-oxoacid ferredoxin oxidoreductase subunit alpha
VFAVVEMSMGQLVDDVRLAVNGRRPVEFLGRCGGNVPSHDEVLAFVHSLARQNLRDVVREKEQMAHA